MMHTHYFLLICCSLLLIGACAEEASPVQGPRLPAPHLRGMSYEQYGIEVKDLKVSQGRFTKGQYLRDLLEANGVTRATVDEVTVAAEGVFDLTRIREGNAYTFLKRPDGSVAYFIYDITDARYVVIDLGKKIGVHTGEKQVEIQWRSVGVQIETSLYEAIAAADLDVRLVGMIEQAVGWSVDFSDLEAGDEVRIIFERPYVEGAPGDITGIVAAQVLHKELSRVAIFFQGDSTGDYYLPEGRNLRPSFLDLPLAGEDRSNLSLQPGPYQAKLIGPVGTPVVAIADGKLTRAIYTRRDGFHVQMEHGPYRSHYTHLDSLRPDLKARGWYLQGDTLGWLPATAAAPAQLQLFEGRKAIDQRQPLPLPGPDIPPSAVRRFESHRDHLMRQLLRINAGSPQRPVSVKP